MESRLVKFPAGSQVIPQRMTTHVMYTQHPTSHCICDCTSPIPPLLCPSNSPAHLLLGDRAPLTIIGWGWLVVHHWTMCWLIGLWHQNLGVLRWRGRLGDRDGVLRGSRGGDTGRGRLRGSGDLSGGGLSGGLLSEE